MNPPGRPGRFVGIGAAGAAILIAVVVAIGPAPWVPRAAAGLLPVAVADTLTIVHDQRAAVAAPGVLANDILVGGGFSAVLNAATTHGHVNLDPDGGYDYDPDGGYVGTDKFTYHVSGGLLNSNVVAVSISIVNNRPVARDDAYTATAGQSRTVGPPGVMANDSDADGDALRAALVTDVSHGSLDLGNDGGFTYTPTGSYAGSDAFSYRITDGIAWSLAATVTLTVRPAPTPTPRPTPTPTPAPTPTPTPTLTPTPAPTPSPTPQPTPRPSPTASPLPPILPPLPSLLPSLLPSVPPTPTPTPAQTRSPSPTPAPTRGPSATDPPPSGGGGASVGSGRPPGSPDGGATSSGTTAGSETSRRPDTFRLGSATFDATDNLFDGSFTGFGNVEWSVPAMVITVPGLLLVLAVLAQSVAGVIWLPVVRRWLGAFGVRRRRERAHATH